MNVLPSSLKYSFRRCARSGQVDYNILARWLSSTSQSFPPYFGWKSHWQRPTRSLKVRQPTAYISILGPKFERTTISGAHREGALEVSGVGIFSAHWAAYCSLRKGSVVTRRNRTDLDQNYLIVNIISSARWWGVSHVHDLWGMGCEASMGCSSLSETSLGVE